MSSPYELLCEKLGHWLSDTEITKDHKRSIIFKNRSGRSRKRYLYLLLFFVILMTIAAITAPE